MSSVLEEVLFRDSHDIQPPAEAYEQKLTENIYANLGAAHFVACPEDIWQPLSKDEQEFGEQEIKGKTRRQEFIAELRLRTAYVLDHKFCVLVVTFMTMWALFMDDLQVSHSSYRILLEDIYSPLWFLQ